MEFVNKLKKGGHMAMTKVKNLKLSDEVFKSGDALPHSLSAGSKSYDGSADVTITAEDLGVGNAYIPKGSISVSDANNGDSATTPATTWEEGWVYNMSDAGTLVNGLTGQITVEVGDNIVRVKDSNDKYRWDKLAATITVPEYVGAAPISVTDGTGAQEGKKVISVATGDGISTSGGSVAVGIDTGAGLKFDNSSPKKIQVNAGNGVKFGTSGAVEVEPKMSGSSNVSGLTVDSSGVSVAPKTNGGITVDANGVSVNVNTSGGLKVDGSGVAVSPATNSGLSVGSGGLAVGAGNGITVSGTSVAVNPDTTSSGANNIKVVQNGVSVSLDQAGNVGSGSGQIANLDGKTLGEIVQLLGGTVSANA
jgi:hypothetical protein